MIIQQETYGPHCSPEEDFFYMFSISFYKSSIISPLDGHGSLSKKSEFPLPKDALCQVWLKLAL